MADISKIQLSDDTQYNLKDAVARSLLTENDTSTGEISKIQLSDNTQYNIKDAVARQDIETVTTDVKAQVNADKDLINGGDNFIDDETLDDYDDKIEEMQEAYKKFIPIQTASGTEIQLDNSNNDQVLVNIGLDGNIEQFTTTGKNLFFLPSAETLNGISYTINNDGTFNLSGTATTNTTFLIYKPLSETYINAETYTLSSTKALPSGVEIRLEGYSDTTWQRHLIGNILYSERQTLTGSANLTNVTRIRTSIFVSSSTTLNISNIGIQLEKGSSVTAFEPYTNGASPNPDYPQEVKTVTGENTINVVGKNLINPNSAYGTSNGITSTYDSDNQSISFSGTTTGTWAYFTNKINVNIPAGEYAFSIDKTVSAHTVIIRMFYNETQYQDITILVNTTSRTITLTNDTIAYQILIGGLTIGTQLNDTLQFQLEKGSTATTYEPYQSQSYTIDLDDVELCKIEDYKDKIYNDDNDKKWYLRKYIAKVILNGTETWKRTTVSATNSSAFWNQYTNLNIPVGTYAKKYCDRFEYQNAIWSSSTPNHLAENNSYTSDLSILFNVDSTIASTLEQWATWLGTNNTTVYYILAEPTTTEITNEALIEQLEAVKLLSGTQNNFTIDADTLPTLNLNYIGEASPHL